MKKVAFLIVLLAAACFAQNPATPSALESDPSGWVDIMPSADLKGWTRLPFMAPALSDVAQWKVDTQNKVLICEGNGGHDWLRYDKELADAIFHVEYRFTKLENGKGYNSGVMLRNNADGTVYFQAQAGEGLSGWLFGSMPVNGAAKRVNTRADLTDARVKPAGEWNTYEVRAEGTKLTAWVNGAVTTVLSDPAIPLKGFAGLEGEGYRIEFRNIKLKELK